MNTKPETQVAMSKVWFITFIVVALCSGLLTPWEIIERAAKNRSVDQEAASVLGFIAMYTLPLSAGFTAIALILLRRLNANWNWQSQVLVPAVILGGTGWVAGELGLNVLLPDYTQGVPFTAGPLTPLVAVLYAYFHPYGLGLMFCALAIGIAAALQLDRWWPSDASH